jgi:hypothetical protein
MNRHTKALMAFGVLLILAGAIFASLPKSWIEDTLGFEPDGGNGLIELAIAIVPIVIGACLLAGPVLLSRRRATQRTITKAG